MSGNEAMLPSPVMVGRYAVVGYDVVRNQPLIDGGTGVLSLSYVQRLAWENEEPAPFTESELKEIDEAVLSITSQLNQD